MAFRANLDRYESKLVVSDRHYSYLANFLLGTSRYLLITYNLVYLCHSTENSTGVNDN